MSKIENDATGTKPATRDPLSPEAEAFFQREYDHFLAGLDAEWAALTPEEKGELWLDGLTPERKAEIWLRRKGS